MINEIILDPLTSDALKEVINIGVGKGAASLNQILDSHVSIEVPDLKLVKAADFIDQYKEQETIVSSINMAFEGELAGNATLMFPKDSASKMVSAMLGDDIEIDDFQELLTSTIHEVGNILINSVMGSLGNSLSKRFDYLPPVYSESSVDNMEQLLQERTIVLVNTRFKIESLSIFGDLLLIFEMKSLENLKKALNALIQIEEDLS